MTGPRDLVLPALILKDSALTANLRAMAAWCAENEFLLAPHGKTSMCLQIFARQMQAGAWAMTVATIPQALVCLESGIKRVLIANQVSGEANIRALAAVLNSDETAEIYCLVDSVAGVRHLAANLESADARRPVGVLVEIGRTGWRTGARSEVQARQVFDAVRESAEHMTFSGFEAFEGMAKNADEAQDFLMEVAAIAGRITGIRAISEELIFSAGGSSYLGPLKRVLSGLKGWKRVVRSGCYVTHDHGIYAAHQTTGLAGDHTLPHFEAALELWAYVQSLPDPGTAILTFGKRNCAYDITLPVPLDLAGAVVRALNDQHAYLSYPDRIVLSVGDMVRLGISHPCTAFDKWRTIPLVDDDYNVIDVYETRF